MTDTQSVPPTPSGGTGHGKSSASLLATYIVLHVVSFLKTHYSIDLGEEGNDIVMAAFVWASVWLTPAHFIATIKQAIADWKEIVRAWKQP